MTNKKLIGRLDSIALAFLPFLIGVEGYPWAFGYTKSDTHLATSSRRSRSKSHAVRYGRRKHVPPEIQDEYE